MKLWLLEPRNDLKPEDNPWEPWYDTADGFVVRAATEAEARELAHADAGSENYRKPSGAPWKDAKYSTCVELTTEGESGTVLMSFQAA